MVLTNYFHRIANAETMDTLWFPPSPLAKLTRWGVERATAERLAERYPGEEIIAQVDVMRWLLAKSGGQQPADPTGWITQALQGDLSPPPGYDAEIWRRPATSSRCRRTMQFLYHGGWLNRFLLSPAPTASRCYVYTLDAPQGTELVAQMLNVTVDQLDWRPHDSALAHNIHTLHLLSVNYVRAAVEAEAARLGAKVGSWKDDIAHRRSPIRVAGNPGVARDAQLIPDASFTLVQEDTVLQLYHELDRGTETLNASTVGEKDWASTVQAYLALSLKESLHVLAVTTAGEDRLTRLREVAASLGDSATFLFAGWNQARDPRLVLTEPIWSTASGRRVKLIDLLQQPHP